MSKKGFHVGRPNLGDRDALIERIDQVLESNWLTNDGPLLRELEGKIGKHLDVDHCVVVANGTVAIELAIHALGLSGDVILPSFTFIATAHAMHWHGIRPVFCDIDSDSLCIDPTCVESLITPKTSAIVGVHVYGRSCDVSALQELSTKYGLPVIYDAAHAIDCTINDVMVGNFGACEIFSFHATKVFNSLEGGAITTNDAALAARLRRLRNFGFPGDGSDITVELGINAKMNEFCAAVGLTNLESLDGFIRVNKSNHSAYRKYLAAITGIELLNFNEGEKNNYQYVIVLVDSDQYGHGRDSLLARLHECGVLARRYFYPGCHQMEPYLTEYPAAARGLPVTEKVTQQVLALPTGTQMEPSDIERICQIIKDYQ